MADIVTQGKVRLAALIDCCNQIAYIVKVLAGTVQIEGRGASDVPRIYTIWPASQEDLPAATSGPWCQERRWLVLDVTDGIAASYIVEGPVAHPEALHRAAEIQSVARTKLKDSKE